MLTDVTHASRATGGARRLVCRAFGDPTAVAIEPMDLPGVGAREVRLQVEATNVSFVDRLIVRGQYQVRPQLPFTPGAVAVGVVDKVGRDLDPSLVGTRRAVLVLGWGSYASHVVAPSEMTSSVPPELDPVDAASVIEAYGTAWFALVDRALVRPGDRVLVLGASGAVGHAAADLAQHLGADVTAATGDPDSCRVALGPIRIIDRHQGPLRDLVRDAFPDGVDLVVDPVGGPWSEPALRTLRMWGQYLVVGFASGQMPTLPINQILLRNRTVIGVEWGSSLLERPPLVKHHVRRVLEAVATGHLHPQPVRRVGLEHLPAILISEMEGGSAPSRIVAIP